MIFDYPKQPHPRRHGPHGYANYQSFKPWLRDEFDFRCVYCLWRERWYAIGEAAFSIEHFRPQAVASHLVCDYDNLLYACCRCNAAKSDAAAILDPCRDAFGDHLVVLSDGRIRSLTGEGSELVRMCKLDQPLLTESRRRMLEFVHHIATYRPPDRCRLAATLLGIPGKSSAAFRTSATWRQHAT